MAPLLVLYDDDCGFCRWSAERLRSWDGHRARLRFAPIQSAEGTAALAQIPEPRRLDSWHVVTTDGVVRSAGAAVPALARRLRGGAPVARLAETFPGLTESVYSLIARHRDRLGRMLGEQACSVHPGR